MYFKTTYDEEFDDLYMHLKAKYPAKLFDLEGIGEQTDLGKFSKKFFSSASTTADASVDANSNVDDMTIVAYENELAKPFTRLNSLYLLWKYGRPLYGTEFSNKLIEKELIGEYYINDLSNVQKPYCYNFSTYDLMMKGLPFVKKIHSKPPKHLSSFCGQMVHFTSYASNQVMGAVGLADLLIVMSYYVKKELVENVGHEDYIWKQVKQELQSLIFSMNQPFRGGLQSGFYNVSVYDKYFLDSLLDDYIFPDGSSPEIELVNKLQDIYLDLMNETMDHSPITFPVTTACFCVDENKNILDKEFLEYISKKNKKWAFINIYAGESSTLSSCCFAGSQKIITKSSDGINYSSFEELYNSKYENKKKNLTILHNGSWVKGKIIRRPKRKMFKVKTVNGKEMFITDNHLNPTTRGDICTEDLTDSDYLLFNNLPLDTYPEADNNLTYEQGYLIGMYLGDGSIYEKGGNCSSAIHLSINESKYKNSIDILKKALIDTECKEEIHLTKIYNNVYPVSIYSNKLANFIRDYVSGNYAHEKELDLKCLQQSRAFRRGILDGFYFTDGGNSNRIYTTSVNLSEQIECLLTSLGLNSIINIGDRTDEKVVIRGEEYNRNYMLYCICWYEPKNERSMKEIYQIRNNNIYFKISSISETHYDEEYVYCFEMPEEEPYFTLPNGIITHNCRLRSKKNNEYLGYANSFGSGGTQIGSFGVVTLNLPKIALKSNGNEEKFFQMLSENAEYAIKINHIKRKLLLKRIEKGALPLYDHGFMDIQKQYATIGLNGINECIEIMGMNILDYDGQEFCKKILQELNNINDKADIKYKYAHNLEQTPSENSAIKLAQKDKLLKLQDKYELYSNQFIPLIVNADLLDRIRLQGMFDNEFSGGSILHVNCDSKVENHKDIMDMIEATVKMGCIYHAINYNLQKCEDGHMSVGQNDICPVCGKPITDNYIRVVGFIVNVKNFHKTRRKEDYAKRQFYHGDNVTKLT